MAVIIVLFLPLGIAGLVTYFIVERAIKKSYEDEAKNRLRVTDEKLVKSADFIGALVVGVPIFAIVFIATVILFVFIFYVDPGCGPLLEP